MTSNQLTIKIRYNKLIGLELSLLNLQQGNDMTKRSVGMSTGQALEFIGYLLQHPNQPVRVPPDHHAATEASRHMLAGQVSYLILRVLNLKCIEWVDKTTAIYRPVVTVDAVVTV